jgi:hypothetical protein
MKRLKLGTGLILASIMALSIGAPVAAQGNSDLPCPDYGDWVWNGTSWSLTGPNDLGSQKFNTTGDPSSVTISAPDGYLISGYCVKGAGVQNLVVVDPPQEEVTIAVDGENNGGNQPAVSNWSLIFVKERQDADYWCSPGFWAQNQGRLAGSPYDPGPYLDDSYVFNGKTYEVGYALANPSKVKGPAFNAAADYLAEQFGWSGSYTSGENCPIDAHGRLLESAQ